MKARVRVSGWNDDRGFLRAVVCVAVRRSLSCLRAAMLLATAVSYIDAQTPQTQFQGKVLDSTRGAIAGAQITVVPDGSTSGPSTVSGQDGAFTLDLLPGHYTIKIAAKGFEEDSETIDLAKSVTK